MSESKSRIMKFVLLTFAVALIGISYVWRAYGIEQLDEALGWLIEVAAIPFYLSVMFYCAWEIRKNWREYKQTNEEDYLVYVIKFGVVFVGLAVVIVLMLYGV
ncbi:MAG: hypothetical protein ACOH1Q_05240 [Thiobacillus sp.]